MQVRVGIPVIVGIIVIGDVSRVGRVANRLCNPRDISIRVLQFIPAYLRTGAFVGNQYRIQLLAAIVNIAVQENSKSAVGAHGAQFPCEGAAVCSQRIQLVFPGPMRVYITHLSGRGVLYVEIGRYAIIDIVEMGMLQLVVAGITKSNGSHVNRKTVEHYFVQPGRR